ncbi:hypothetical protein INT47_002967 [Mucor saturninus]|uniref:Uncharacterized protein n=1 Tax=Mucor saturninus TaxID=64648 RepID=A0A8H7QUD5_9FUNG|nr:hypothetical protein INT47_002967 [Mucor saturninus]
MPPIQHFKTVFWSQKQPELTLPDFQTGYAVLHQKLGQSKVENEEMISFFKDRIAIEESYSSKLSDQGKSSLKSTGFGRDEGAGLLKCFTQLKETSRRIGEQHKTTAAAVTSHVLVPLQEFHEDYKRNVSHSKQAVDSMLKQFDGLIKEAERSRHVYHRKCKDADKAEEQALKNAVANTPATATEEKQANVPTPPPQEDMSANINIQLGNQIMPQSELDSLVRRMRQEITVQDHRVPILGTYKNTSTGEDIAIWLQHNLPQCKDSPAMADVVGQQLIQPYNILRLIGQRGNKFTASSNSFYQWRVVGDDDSSSVSSSTTEATYNALGGLMEKIVTPPIVSGAVSEEPHKKTRREAEKADQAYRSTVIKLDQMRMAIEEAMFAHLTEMEQVELQRIQQLKDFISSFIASMSVLIPQDKLVIEEMMVFQESLKPDQDIQFIVQQYAVSGFSPKAILYDNYYHGISHDQVFGVPLEDLGKQSPDNVPRFVSEVLAAIEKGAEKIDDVEVKEKLWSTPYALDRVHATCLELNVGSDALTPEMLGKYEPQLLVAVLRYFLLELPEWTILLKRKKLDGEQDETLRLAPFSNLISTLPGSHFATLKLIFENITRFISNVGASDETINLICQSLGPVVLRARVDSFSILNSKTPVKFVQELIKHSKEIFSESTLKLHAESEKRRLARPIIAPQPQGDETKSTSKRANTLMSFMRPTISTAEELNKWTVNSMMGVFQRNTNQSPTDQQPPPPATTNRSVPLAFGSTITQDSPPSSPRLTAATAADVEKVEENKVMFDGDHIFDDEVQNSKSEDILKDIEEKSTDTKETTNDEKKKEEDNTQQRPSQGGHIDSSFFDDDDEEDEN